MPRFRVAHIREQGVDMIIIPLDSSFGSKSNNDQNLIRRDLENRSHSAGLAGSVVLVWDAGAGRMGFLAPPNWRPFVESINLEFVTRNLNMEIYW